MVAVGGAGRSRHQARPLGRLVRDGLGWSILNTLLGRAGTMLCGVVLARILTPRDYGVFAVALVALNAVLSLNELGVSLAIVRWPGEVAAIAPTVTTLAWAGSALCFGACFAAAPWFARALGAPAATGLVRLLAVSVLLDGLTSVPAAQLARSFQQGRRTVGDLANFAVSTTVAIVLAAQGHGAWSLAWSRLAGNLASAVLFWLLATERHAPGFDRRRARDLLAFGLPLAGSSVLVFAMLNIDYVIVGSSLGAAALGAYLLAFNLASWPVNMFSTVVRRVSLAGFSRLQDDPVALRSGFARSLSVLLAVAAPACALLAGFAPALVRFVYGGRWSAAAGALEFLAVLGGVRIGVELAYDYLVAVGRTRAVLWLQGGWLLALGPALLAGARLAGIRGVAAGHAAVALLLVCPAFAVALRRAGVGLRAVAASLARPAAGAALVVLAGTAAARLLRPDAAVLGLGGTVALAGYGLTVAPLRRLLRARPAERPAERPALDTTAR